MTFYSHDLFPSEVALYGVKSYQTSIVFVADLSEGSILSRYNIKMVAMAERCALLRSPCTTSLSWYYHGWMTLIMILSLKQAFHFAMLPWHSRGLTSHDSGLSSRETARRSNEAYHHAEEQFIAHSAMATQLQMMLHV